MIPRLFKKTSRNWLVTSTLLLTVFMGFSTVSTGQESPGEDDAAKGKPKIAVWDFNLSGISKSDGQAITNRLRSTLVNTRLFRVMTRDQIDTLLGEQALGQTLIDAKQAIKTGKLKGVKYVVTGSLISVRGAYQGTFEMINGKTGEIMDSLTPPTFRGDFLDFLDFEVPKVAQKLVGVAQGNRGGSVAFAPLPKKAPLSSKRVVGKKNVVFLPPMFKGKGSINMLKEVPEFEKKLQAMLATEFTSLNMINPFREAEMGSPQLKKLKRSDLRATVWNQLGGLSIGTGRPNYSYIKEVATDGKIDITVFYSTTSNMGLFTSAIRGNFKVYLYDPSSGKKFNVNGKWEQSKWQEDIMVVIKKILHQYGA